MDNHPLKRFGQNFLIDQNVIKKIISELNPSESDTVLEIGPGRGALTEHLIKLVPNFYAVEIDKKIAAELKERFPESNIINNDILKTDLTEISAKEAAPLRIIGNIPYNITSPIIFKLIENMEIVNDAVLMVQLEVAKRISGKKGTADYGILSIILNYFADIKLCFKISRNVFFPKPNVDSAVIHLKFKKDLDSQLNSNLFIKLVKEAFGKRRKTLKNSLRNSIFDSQILYNSGIDLSLRAEQLEIKDFVYLTKLFQ